MYCRHKQSAKKLLFCRGARRLVARAGATSASAAPSPAREENHPIAVMLRPLARHGGAARHWLNCPHARCYSALSSSIKISSVPAPHAGSITVISLNRPQARNALSTQLLSELSGVVEGLHREGGQGSTRALILASEADQAFCAGADLKERAGMSQDECVDGTDHTY